MIDELAAIITITEQLYLRTYWVSAKTGFDKRRRWSQSFPLPNFSASVLVVEAGDFPYIFPDSTKYTALYGSPLFAAELAKWFVAGCLCLRRGKIEGIWYMSIR